MILDFAQIHKDDILKAGGKGANLGEMTAAGINVPKGFVITAEAYRKFLKENKIDEIISRTLVEKQTEEQALLSAAGEFRKKIIAGHFPAQLEKEIRKKYAELGESARVAVRSSATAEDLPDASFAGQQETYLNVQGIEDVLIYIRHCYASLWGDRAVSYRFNQGYNQSTVAIAVVIQEMVESEKAGVLFTLNPVRQNKDEMQINASYGLGESVVSGRVTADNYIVNKSGNIIEINIGSKETQIVYGDKNTKEEAVSEAKRIARALNDTEIDGLVKAGLKIEKHYGMPMDIEWAIRKNEIYILQARAITTLKNNDDKKLIQKYIQSKPLTKSTKENMAFLLEKMPFAYRVLDFDYMMAINDQKARIFAEGGLVFNSNPAIDDDGIQTVFNIKKRLSLNIFHIFKIIRMLKNFDYCSEVCKKFMAHYEKEIERIKTLDFQNMSLAECSRFMEQSYELVQQLAYDRFKYALFPSFFMSKKFTKIIKRVDKNYSAFDFYWELNNKTAVIANDISRIADEIKKNAVLTEAVLSGEKFKTLCAGFPEFKRLADDFINRNGFKSDYNCYCIEAKTFIEDSDRLVNIIHPLLSADVQDSYNEKDKKYSSLMRNLQRLYGNKYPRIEKDIQHFRYFHVVREESQYLWEAVFYYVRQCVRRINILLLNSEDYKHGIVNLFHRELMEVLKAGRLTDAYKEKIRRRNKKFPLAEKVWEASKLLVFDSKGDVLKGVSGSPGTVVGKACLICKPEEFYKIQKGDVLVCHLTDPEWTPLFKLASAVVADTGSALSHAAIVAREFNIPAVLGVGFATAKFKDGDFIKVDGNKGEVRSC
ncbi:phosphoenolpyruvate synthase [Treponema denticola]|uniref:Phosphoenolpyruvate synthase n=1 Tax=Treponema denticola TaxID=158 RepID=A0A9Q9EXT8_TREDN|nr:PEP/pyruvate-binding domain-containing protein [Treponema denticola]UTC89518.1 phosphoenolpyruvate synthase [Treponema denticola]UTD01129.1 phosphoenolpyruvate synthase [Treponema denticola]